MSTKNMYNHLIRKIYDPPLGHCGHINECAVLAKGAGYKLFNWNGMLHQIIDPEDVRGINSLPLQVGKGNVFFLRLEINMDDLIWPVQTIIEELKNL